MDDDSTDSSGGDQEWKDMIVFIRKIRDATPKVGEQFKPDHPSLVSAEVFAGIMVDYHSALFEHANKEDWLFATKEIDKQRAGTTESTEIEVEDVSEMGARVDITELSQYQLNKLRAALGDSGVDAVLGDATLPAGIALVPSTGRDKGLCMASASETPLGESFRPGVVFLDFRDRDEFENQDLFKEAGDFVSAAASDQWLVVMMDPCNGPWSSLELPEFFKEELPHTLSLRTPFHTKVASGFVLTPLQFADPPPATIFASHSKKAEVEARLTSQYHMRGRSLIKEDVDFYTLFIHACSSNPFESGVAHVLGCHLSRTAVAQACVLLHRPVRLYISDTEIHEEGTYDEAAVYEVAKANPDAYTSVMLDEAQEEGTCFYTYDFAGGVHMC